MNAFRRPTRNTSTEWPLLVRRPTYGALFTRLVRNRKCGKGISTVELRVLLEVCGQAKASSRNVCHLTLNWTRNGIIPPTNFGTTPKQPTRYEVIMGIVNHETGSRLAITWKGVYKYFVALRSHIAPTCQVSDTSLTSFLMTRGRASPLCPGHWANQPSI